MALATGSRVLPVGVREKREGVFSNVAVWTMEEGAAVEEVEKGEWEGLDGEGKVTVSE